MSQTSTTNLQVLLYALLTVCGLSACGGGGGGNSANSPTSAQPTPAPVPLPVAPPSSVPTPSPTPAPIGPAFISSSIRTEARAPTFAVGTLNRRTYDLLNAELSRCGFGYSYQDVRLDRAAKAHGEWMALNRQFSHTADGVRFPNGFTGTTPTDRARFQGYPNGTGEDIALTEAVYGDAANENQNTEYLMRALLAAPFHLISLASSPNDVGIAAVRAGDLGLMSGVGGLNRIYLTVVPASVTTQPRQDISSQEVETYPCEGSTNVHGAVRGEDPNPVPGRDLARNPIGNGILVRSNLLSKVEVSSFTIVEAGTTTPLQVLPPVEFPSVKVYFTDLPLKANTRYTVTTSGTADGVAFRKSFTYTTGSNY